jgi:hypothetical protein
MQFPEFFSEVQREAVFSAMPRQPQTGSPYSKMLAALSVQNGLKTLDPL